MMKKVATVATAAAGAQALGTAGLFGNNNLVNVMALDMMSHNDDYYGDDSIFDSLLPIAALGGGLEGAGLSEFTDIFFLDEMTNGFGRGYYGRNRFGDIVPLSILMGGGSALGLNLPQTPLTQLWALDHVSDDFGGDFMPLAVAGGVFPGIAQNDMTNLWALSELTGTRHHYQPRRHYTPRHHTAPAVHYNRPAVHTAARPVQYARPTQYARPAAHAQPVATYRH
jgi:hypothetical protein